MSAINNRCFIHYSYRDTQHKVFKTCILKKVINIYTEMKLSVRSFILQKTYSNKSCRAVHTVRQFTLPFLASITTGVYLTNGRHWIDRATKHRNIYPASRIMLKNVIIFRSIDKTKTTPLE